MLTRLTYRGPSAASGISDHIGAKAPCVCLSTADAVPLYLKDKATIQR